MRRPIWFVLLAVLGVLLWGCGSSTTGSSDFDGGQLGDGLGDSRPDVP